MPGKDALQRLREAMKADMPPVPFIGAGLSLAVTGNSSNAGWIGLLRDGVDECEREVPELPYGWVGRMNDQLDHADVYTCIAVGDEIRRRLRNAGGERKFESWIDGAVGKLVPTPEGEQIIRSVRRLGKIIVTTNYDTLVETLDPPWKPYTWTDREYRLGQRLQNAVLHMHGVVGKPRSIILSSADYERLSEEKLAQVLNQAFFASLDFVYIGCGDGLSDPHIAPLMGFLDQINPDGETQHYVLVRGDQLRQFQESRLSHLISPVAYGSNFLDLGPFLSKLAAREEIEASQDPRFYENVSAKPRRALLDLAAPAQEKVRRGMSTVQRAMHAMGQVEHRGIVPAGMASWDYDDQRAVHEQLAASVTSPAAHLAKCLAEMVPVFTDLGADTGQLTAAKFAAYAARLEPIILAVSDLAQHSALLFARVTSARDDLDARCGICADYGIPYHSLCDAYDYIDQANSIVMSLGEDLNRVGSLSLARATNAVTRP